MSGFGHGMPASQFNWHAQVCKNKTRYSSASMARVYAKGTKRRFNRPMRVYLCPVCAGYHLRSVE
jgi:hypothetical protein